MSFPVHLNETTDLPNDGTTAETLSLGGTFIGSINGDIGDRGDWIAVQLEAGQKYVFSLTSEWFDTYLHLYDSAKNLVTFNDDDSGLSQNSEMSFIATITDTYYVKATYFNNRGFRQADREYELSYAARSGEIVLGTDGNDSITLLGAVDYVYANSGFGDDTVIGGDGACLVYGSDGNDLLIGGAGQDTLHGGNGEDSIYGGEGNDEINGYYGNDSIEGGAGNDYLSGGNENDTLIGGEGNDQLAGGLGDDGLNGGVGNDTLSANDGNDTLIGGEGDDQLAGGRGNDDLNGGAGNDALWASDGDDRLDGGDGNDSIYGGQGADVLLGGAGDDFLNGVTGDDVLDGGDGDDLMIGGGGADTFVFSTGSDEVFEFSLSESDVVDLSGVAEIIDFADLVANHLTEVDGFAVISDGNVNAMTLRGVAVDDLSVDDFLF